MGKLPEEIIGKKCYEVFHGMNGPWKECPHQKTVEQKKAFVEEVEDPYLGGTFITSSSPIFDTSGEFIGTVNVLSDITELGVSASVLSKQRGWQPLARLPRGLPMKSGTLSFH